MVLLSSVAYERAVEEQQVQLEMSQAKREIKVYMDNVAMSKEIDAIVDRKKRRREVEGEGSKEGEEEEGLVKKGRETAEDEEEEEEEKLEGKKVRECIYSFQLARLAVCLRFR